LKGRVCCETSV